MELRTALKARKLDNDLLAEENETFERRELSADFINRCDFHFYPDDVLRNDWQIIPAELKVLTADELEQLYVHGQLDEYELADIRELTINAHQNGRVERDLEWKKLIEDKRNDTGVFGMIDGFFSWDFINKNLPPLNKNEIT